jgi:hypothetical protein
VGLGEVLVRRGRRGTRGGDREAAAVLGVLGVASALLQLREQVEEEEGDAAVPFLAPAGLGEDLRVDYFQLREAAMALRCGEAAERGEKRRGAS